MARNDTLKQCVACKKKIPEHNIHAISTIHCASCVSKYGKFSEPLDGVCFPCWMKIKMNETCDTCGGALQGTTVPSKARATTDTRTWPWPMTKAAQRKSKEAEQKAKNWIKIARRCMRQCAPQLESADNGLGELNRILIKGSKEHGPVLRSIDGISSSLASLENQWEFVHEKVESLQCTLDAIEISLKRRTG